MASHSVVEPARAIVQPSGSRVSHLAESGRPRSSTRRPMARRLREELIDPKNIASAVWADGAYRSAENKRFLAPHRQGERHSLPQAHRQPDGESHGLGECDNVRSPHRRRACTRMGSPPAPTPASTRQRPGLAWLRSSQVVPETREQSDSTRFSRFWANLMGQARCRVGRLAKQLASVMSMVKAQHKKRPSKSGLFNSPPQSP